MFRLPVTKKFGFDVHKIKWLRNHTITQTY